MITVRTRTKFHLGRRGTIILCAILGIVLLLAGINLLSRSIKITNNGISVEAQVTNVKTKRIGRKTSYTPEIRFTTSRGETVNVQLQKSTGSPAYSVGDKVSIIYSQDDPKKVLVDTVFNKYGFPIIFMATGIISLLIGVLKIIRKV
jgi:NADH:ubiquinone oxidoreductase subunit 6 (subunit J)